MIKMKFEKCLEIRNDRKEENYMKWKFADSWKSWELRSKFRNSASR